MAARGGVQDLDLALPLLLVTVMSRTGEWVCVPDPTGLNVASAAISGLDEAAGMLGIACRAFGIVDGGGVGVQICLNL